MRVNDNADVCFGNICSVDDVLNDLLIIGDNISRSEGVIDISSKSDVNLDDVDLDDFNVVDDFGDVGDFGDDDDFDRLIPENINMRITA